MWDLILSVPDHCLSFYFTSIKSSEKLQENLADIVINYSSKQRETNSQIQICVLNATFLIFSNCYLNLCSS